MRTFVITVRETTEDPQLTTYGVNVEVYDPATPEMVRHQLIAALSGLWDDTLEHPQLQDDNENAPEG